MGGYEDIARDEVSPQTAAKAVISLLYLIENYKKFSL
jgi:hypothetical protein